MRQVKLIHLADLHIGKRVHEHSMHDEQSDVLGQILEIVRSEAPDGVLIAGDVYDRPVPSVEAMGLFDAFLTSLAELGQEVFIISGNHDSADRLAFGARLLAAQRIHLAEAYGGRVEPITLTDAHGELDVWLLPFVKPFDVRRAFPDDEITSYTDAVAHAIGGMAIDPARRNILVTHQFVCGGVTADSEEPSVGGSDAVDLSVFDAFDYVALGHLHRPQRVGRETVRYAGSPLKYSFSEVSDVKSVTVVELGEKGNVQVRALPLTPKRELAELRGTYDGLMRRSFYEGTPYPEQYLHITLTDETDIPDAAARLRVVYPHLLWLDYDNLRTRDALGAGECARVEEKTPIELFGELFEKQNGKKMSDEQAAYLAALIERVWEEGEPI